jgi:hypothetical protein
MGDFIKQSDINMEIALLANLTGSSDSTPVKKVFNMIIDQTEGLVKAFLGIKVDLPLDDTLKTPALILWVNDIFEYRLYKYSRKAIPEDVLLDYEKAEKKLTMLGKEISFGADTTDEDAERRSFATSFNRG